MTTVREVLFVSHAEAHIRWAFAREQPGGLAGIFRDYQSWLTTQAWYQFETAEPDQIN